jgi:O-antigen/teichoic acid export membrane protein
MDIKNTIKNIVLNPSAFFLKNSGTKQIIVKNTFWLSFSMVISKIIKYFLIIYAARILGATEYGVFNFALAFVALFNIFADLGITSLIARETAKGEESEIHISAAFTLKLFLTIATLALVVIASFLVPQASGIRLTILVLTGYILISGFSGFFYNCFYGRQEMQYQSITEIISVTITTALGVYLITLISKAYFLAIAYLVGAVVGLLIISFIFRKKFGTVLKLDFNKREWKRIFSWSWPLALGGLFASVYTNIDSLMMGFWHLFTQIGYYNAAQKIVAMAILPAGLIATSFFPALTKANSEQEKKKMQKLFDYQNVILTILAIPIMVGGYILANGLIIHIYGTAYQPAVLALRILLLMGGISYLAASSGRVLFIYNQQKRTFWIAVWGALLNVILNIILIPQWGLYGAAWASVATFSLALILLWYYLRKLTPLKIFNWTLIKYLLASIIASILMALILKFLAFYNVDAIIKVIIGALSYFIILGGFWFLKEKNKNFIFGNK